MQLIQPDLDHDLRNKIWGALEILKIYLQKAENDNKDISALIKVKTALEQSLDLLDGKSSHVNIKNLSQMVRNSLIDIKPIARARKINLEIETADIPLPVSINKFVFLRIIHNIVLNALEAAASRVTVRCGYYTGDYGGSVSPAVTVRNDGNSIDPVLLPGIFTKGFSTKGEGRGRGLSIVKQLLEENNGDLILFTSPGETEFLIIPGGTDE
ncbi:sensor histidine kinase [Thermodesulfatator indicus]|uniref:sensor histidine kinase n=1 Tax=Thermodesulfatator indicus TaxID=171695 RepID=UPI000312665E|nr:HAMP domain-containing sensor histidine kinase [Thermodesulfatator indicus]